MVSFRKWRVGLAAAAMAAVGVAAPLALTSSSASASTARPADSLAFFGKVCTNGGYCWNAWGGDVGNGNPVKFEKQSYNGSFSNMNVWNEGAVTSSFPFNPGTAAYNQGLPSYYAGHPVYKISYAPNGVGSGKCVSNDYFGGGDVQAQWEPCGSGSSDASQLWIYSAAGFLVNVYATEVAYADQLNYKMVAGTSSFGQADGNRVFVTQPNGTGILFKTA